MHFLQLIVALLYEWLIRSGIGLIHLLVNKWQNSSSHFWQEQSWISFGFKLIFKNEIECCKVTRNIHVVHIGLFVFLNLFGFQQVQSSYLRKPCLFTWLIGFAKVGLLKKWATHKMLFWSAILSLCVFCNMFGRINT